MAAAVLAGCGGHDDRAVAPQPKLPRAVAVQLETLSQEVAVRLDGGDPCGALAAAHTLQQKTIEAINARRVPAALQEPLQSTATSIAARIECSPRAAPVTPAEPTVEANHRKPDKHDKRRKHGEGDGD